MPPDLESLAILAGARFRNHASHCPLHGGDNPNAFHLYDHDRRWHCFTRCPPGQNDGDAVKFYMLWKDVSYGEAIRELAGACDDRSHTTNASLGKNPLNPLRRTALVRPESVDSSRASSFLAYARDCLLHPASGAAARDYLRLERGLDDRACDVFQLGLNPTDLHDDPVRWGLAGEKRLFLPLGLLIPRFYRGRLLALKIRRPLPGEPLAHVFAPEPSASARCGRLSKFLSVRGSLSGLFGCDTWLGYPALLLVEGEWDCMLAWSLAGDLCDVGTLGSASQGLSPHEELELYAYRRILVVYDADPAGQAARQRLQALARGFSLEPPAHDLCDHWRQGGDLRLWLQSHLAKVLPGLQNSSSLPAHGPLEAAPVPGPR